MYGMKNGRGCCIFKFIFRGLNVESTLTFVGLKLNEVFIMIQIKDLLGEVPLKAKQLNYGVLGSLQELHSTEDGLIRRNI